MITAEMKDKILTVLATDAQLERLIHFPTILFAEEIGVPKQYVEPIMRQFERNGLISEFVYGNREICFVCHAELHDFYRKGGFLAQEAITQTQLEKMYTELLVLQKELEPDHLDKANKLSGIIQGVAGLLQFITTIKK